MPKPKRLLAEPVSKIQSLHTNGVVGWIYRWDNGDVQAMWLQDEALVIYKPVGRDQGENQNAVVV